MTGDEARAKLRATIDSGGVIIGAGAGTGLSAKCAEAGGTDLIIIYNSGRYRMAGRGSLAGLMPYGDANAIVMDMASEVLPVVSTPPCWRACAAPTLPADTQLPGRRPRRGLRGCSELPDGRSDRRHLPGQPRGNRHGLRPRGGDDRSGVRAWAAHVPYVFDPESAEKMTRAGADVLVPHMGLTTKGTIGAHTAKTLDDCVEEIQAMRDAAVAVNPDVIVLATVARLRSPRTPPMCSSAPPAWWASSARRAWNGCPPRWR